MFCANIHDNNIMLYIILLVYMHCMHRATDQCQLPSPYAITPCYYNIIMCGHCSSIHAKIRWRLTYAVQNDSIILLSLRPWISLYTVDQRFLNLLCCKTRCPDKRILEIAYPLKTEIFYRITFFFTKYLSLSHNQYYLIFILPRTLGMSIAGTTAMKKLAQIEGDLVPSYVCQVPPCQKSVPNKY